MVFNKPWLFSKKTHTNTTWFTIKLSRRIKFTHRTLHTAIKLMFGFNIKYEERLKHIRNLNLNKLIP